MILSQCFKRHSERSHCKKCKKDECNCNVAKTQNINNHRPIGYSILFVDSEDKVFFQEEYAGVDCVKHFFHQLNKYKHIVEDHKKKFKKSWSNQSYINRMGNVS